MRRKWAVVCIYQPPRYWSRQSSRGRCEKWWPSTYTGFESDSDEEWGDDSTRARPAAEDYCGTALRCSDDEFMMLFDVISTSKVEQHPIVGIVDCKPCLIASGSHHFVCKSRICQLVCELRSQMILTNCNQYVPRHMQESAESNAAHSSQPWKHAWRDHRFCYYLLSRSKQARLRVFDCVLLETKVRTCEKNYWKLCNRLLREVLKNYVQYVLIIIASLYFRTKLW